MHIPLTLAKDTKNKYLKSFYTIFYINILNNTNTFHYMTNSPVCKVHHHTVSNLLFAKNLSTGLWLLFLLHFCERKLPFNLLQWSLATLTNDIRALKSSL